MKLLDPRRLKLHRRDEARREEVNLAVESHEAVSHEIVIGPRRAKGALVGLAGDLVLVLAKDHVAFEVNFHGLVGVLDQLAVGTVDLFAFLGIGVAPHDGALGLDVHDRRILRALGDHVDSAPINHHTCSVGLRCKKRDVGPAAAAREDRK